jgi:catechol 2,3-dioxygenase-like lactoylglutathione lyase family enzyme
MVTPILSVADIDASIAYYTIRLGFTLNWRLTGDEDPTTTRILTTQIGCNKNFA